MTSPLPERPTSSEVAISQDCAFPPFPTKAQSHSVTPTAPSDVQHPGYFASRSSRIPGATDYTQAPMSSRRSAGGKVLQRMNTIAPGPFNICTTSDDHASIHKRNATLESSKSLTRTSSSTSARSMFQRPATADPSKARQSSLYSMVGESRNTVFQPDTPPLSAGYVPFDFSSLRNEDPLSPFTPLSAPSSAIEPLREEHRSRTFPIGRDTMDEKGSSNPHLRRPSEPSPRERSMRPLVSAANRPLDEIGSTSSFKPSRKASQAKNEYHPESVRSGSANGDRTDPRLSNAPPVPLPGQGGVFDTTSIQHTSIESISSNTSSSSDIRSGSSRSSPPLSDVSLSWTRPSDAQPGGPEWAFPAALQTSQAVEESAPARRVPPMSFSRPMYVTPLEPPRRVDSIPPVLDSPTDPAISNGCFTPTQTNPPLETTNIIQPANLTVPSIPQSIPKRPSLPTRRSTTKNKGHCRGCGVQIVGKSVSSADGRLTGHYHKQCFVCQTCKGAFQTADFYVIDNHPYCERHYHELNGSLCKCCDQGIEGQYLETELKQKFHPHCFTCQVNLHWSQSNEKHADGEQDCHRLLRDDYFEMNGRVYCEQHAFRAAQQTSLLGPGRRYPERRTTRLMMM